MSKVVRISDKAYEKLESFAYGFDSISKVVDRVVDTVTVYDVFRAQDIESKEYHQALDVICGIADKQSWCIEAAIFAHTATDNELVDYIKNRMI